MIPVKEGYKDLFKYNGGYKSHSYGFQAISISTGSREGEALRCLCFGKYNHGGMKFVFHDCVKVLMAPII